MANDAPPFAITKRFEGDAVALLEPVTLRVLHLSPAFTHRLGAGPLPDAVRRQVVTLLQPLRPDQWATGMLDLNGSEARVTVGLTSAGVLLALEHPSVSTMKAQLAALQRRAVVGQYALGAVHDFNNQLQVAEGLLADLSQSLEGNDLSLLADLHEAVRRAAGLSHALLRSGRGTGAAGRRVDLSALVKHLEPLLRRTLPRAITLRTTLADGAYALIDVDALEQVLLNLVLNARDAMPKGGELELSTSRVSESSEARPRVRLSVKDTGVGIAAPVLDRLFEPFFTTKAHGTGLGLANARALIDASGGQLQVESVVGLGTMFHLTLPAAPAAQP